MRGRIGARLAGLTRNRSRRGQEGPADAPPLWNDLGRPPSPPLPSPSETLAELDATGARELLATAMGAIEGTEQHKLMDELGLERLAERARADRIPIPADHDREGYMEGDDLGYWLFGLGDALLIARTARELGRQLGAESRMLDFGCASGRVLRHLGPVTGARAEGADIGPHNVEWARLHLPAETPVALNPVLPSLPYADERFDAIYAGSVFTHIDEFEQDWLLELRRVLRRGGFALVTFHPGRLWEQLRDPAFFLRAHLTGSPHRMDPPGEQPVTATTFDRPLPAQRVVFTQLDWPVNSTNLIHTHTWIRERWGPILRLERIVERAHGTHQDAAILVRNPEPAASA